jgi:hypothetical protein
VLDKWLFKKPGAHTTKALVWKGGGRAEFIPEKIEGGPDATDLLL